MEREIESGWSTSEQVAELLHITPAALTASRLRGVFHKAVETKPDPNNVRWYLYKASEIIRLKEIMRRGRVRLETGVRVLRTLKEEGPL